MIPPPPLQEADLLFIVSGDSEFSEAITSATARHDDLKFDHVAMVYFDGEGNPNVLEASPKYGVHSVSLEEFVENSSLVCGKPGIVVMRLDIDFPAQQAIMNATNHIGAPYDWFYLPDNGMMYCSELIYESYIDNEGDHIFKSAPMNFRAEDGSMPEFWIKLYGELGCEVPEGLPGTNPQDLSKDPNLKEIYHYF